MFSNDFVQNVKHSSDSTMKINSMLMYYTLGTFCSYCLKLLHVPPIHKIIKSILHNILLQTRDFTQFAFTL